MDISLLAIKIAARYLEAAGGGGSDVEALELQGVFTKVINSGTKGLGLDWSWDAVELGGRGASPGYFSIACKPSIFDEKGILGGVQLRGTFDKAGNVYDVELEAGHYHKHHEGGGIYSYKTPLGDHYVDITGPSTPLKYDIAKNPDYNHMISEIKKLINHIVAHPPKHALSQSKKWVSKRLTDKKIQQIVQQSQQSEKARKETVGDPDWFCEQILAEDGEFGQADLNRHMQERFPNIKERSVFKQPIIDELANRGCIFKPALPLKSIFSSKLSPDSIVQAILTLADYIETANQPDRSIVASRIQDIINGIVLHGN